MNKLARTDHTGCKAWLIDMHMKRVRRQSKHAMSIRSERVLLNLGIESLIFARGEDCGRLGQSKLEIRGMLTFLEAICSTAHEWYDLKCSHEMLTIPGYQDRKHTAGSTRCANRDRCHNERDLGFIRAFHLYPWLA